MSADDFQTKYSSVMEGMLKGAIAETTKLFETMVDELKAEISKIKKENEDLKTKCSQFESERNQPTVDTRESEPLPGPSDGSEKRDRAVQCDLVPFRTMLVEHCQQLSPSSLQNQEQQCGYEEMEYSLQDHNYGEPNAQMAFILVKQKDSSGESSVQMQEIAEPTNVCGLVLSDKAGSPRESTCGTENEGPLIDQECSTGGIPLPQKDGEAKVALELPCLEKDKDVQRAQNQSSVSVSLAEIKDAMEEDSQGSQKISETQGELIPSEKQLVVAQHQSEVEPLENKQPSVVPQQCEGLTGGLAEGEASPQPELPVPRRRGRPPKKAKGLKQPVKKIGSPAVSVASLSRRCYNEKGKPSGSQQYTTEIEEGAIQTPFTEVSTAVETQTTQTVQPRERCTSVTLQDAMLLVEAMNQSPVENTLSSPQKVAAHPKTQCAPSVSTLQTVVEVSAESGALPLPVETHKAAGNLPVIELSKTTKCTKEKLSAAPTTAGATPTNEAQAPMKVVKPKQQHTVIPSNTTTSLMPSSIAPVQTSVQFLQQHPPTTTTTLITSVAVSKQGKAVSQITVMPRSVSSLNPHKIAALSSTQLPAVVSTVVAAQKKCKLPGLTTAVLPLGTPPLSSVPQKTIYVTSGNSFPVVPSLSTATSTDPQSGTLPHPKITIIIPRQVSAVASRKSQSKTIVLTTKQEPEKSTVPVTVLSPQFVSSSQELGISVETQTTSDEVDTKLSQKRDDTLDNLESPKQTASESETINAPRETCSSVNMSLGPVSTSLSPAVLPTCEQKLSAVVRLTRLPFRVSVKEAVFVSRLPTEGSSETQSISKECTTQEKPSSVVISTQPSETLVLSTDICPNVKEASVALSVNTSQMSEESNDIQQNASLFSENCSILEESPDSGYVQPSTPSKVSAPVLDNSTIAVNTTEAPAGGPTTNSDEEIFENCELPNDPPIEEKLSTPVIQLTSIATKDTSDPHLQMTKAQFLAQLAVSPVTQDLQKASFDDPVDATASFAATSRSDKKMLPKKSVVAKLRSHLKTQLQARRSEPNPEPHTETETSTVNPKRPRLENESPNAKNTPREPIPLSPKNLGAVEDVRSSKLTTNDPTPISPRRSGLRKDGVRPKRNVNEPTSVRSMRVKATRKSSPVSHRRSSSGRDGVGSKTKKSSSVSPNQSSSIQGSASSKKTKSTSVSPGRSSPVKESANSRKTKSTLVSPRRSSLIQELAISKNTKSTSVSPRRSDSIKESASSKKTKSTSVSPRRSDSIKESASSKKTNSTSVSPRRSNSVKESTSSKKTKSSSVSPRRSNFVKENASSKKTKSSSVSPRRSNSVKEKASSKMTKSTLVGPRRSSSIKESASFKKTKNMSVSPRTSSSRDGASPKKTKSAVSPRMSGLSKNGATPKVPTSELTSFCRRRCTFTKVGSSSKQVNWESNSFSPRYSITTDGAGTKNTRSESGSPSVRWPKLAKDVVSPRKKGEPTAAKKPRLVQDSPGPQKNLRVVNAKKLAKAAKAKTMAKIKKSAELKLQNGAKTSQLADNCASSGTVRKFTAKAVWTPPRMSVSKKTPPGGKKEVRSPSSQDHPLVFPPSVSLFPIPIRGPPVVSPLQPLSVIGRRLLKNQCGECGQVLSSIAALESHVSLHTGRRPFSCTLCGKSFPDTKGLKRHGRVHRNGRIHICHHCGKGFVYRFGLTKHLQMVHSRIKPFICQICNKGFFTKRDVEAHIRMHTGEKPFHCNLCDKKFARRVELNVHLRWHNGEKRHWCPFCGKGFLDFNNLKRHKYIHTGEKPHSCPHCPKHFTQSGHLKKHVKNVHKIP